MKIFLRNFMIFCVGFTIYQCLEGLWKYFGTATGAESFCMGILGGLSLLLVGGLNKVFKWETPIWLQALIGGFGILFMEFVTGLLLNKWLCPLLNKPLIWDYSKLPGNILGQVCPQFFLIWILLAVVCILLDDYLRWKMYDEEKPHYTWWWKK